MSSTQCEYNYQLVGLYPVIDDSICTTTGTQDVIETGRSAELQQTEIIALAVIIFVLFFWMAYTFNGGKKAQRTTKIYK